MQADAAAGRLEFQLDRAIGALAILHGAGQVAGRQLFMSHTNTCSQLTAVYGEAIGQVEFGGPVAAASFCGQFVIAGLQAASAAQHQISRYAPAVCFGRRKATRSREALVEVFVEG